MTPSRGTLFAFSILALLMVWVTVFVFLRGYRTDLLRERFESLLARLFDHAASGYISFNHPVYLWLRRFLQACASGADRITFGRLVIGHTILALFGKNARWNPAQELRAQIAALESLEARERLLEVHDNMQLALARHLLLSSPLLWGWAVVAWLRGATSGDAAGVWRRPEDLVPGLGLLESVLPGTASANFD